nr:MAG TPA_asm: hypothetical protein [Caudoviricetes sp.]
MKSLTDTFRPLQTKVCVWRMRASRSSDLPGKGLYPDIHLYG